MTIAVLLSGGTGSRLGEDTPKQYLEVGGMPMISYCIRTLSEHPGIDGIQIVAAEEWQEKLRLWINEADANRKFRGFSLPGETRQLSILNGLRGVRTYASEEAAVLIHDAARPLLSVELISECLAALGGHDGVLPVLPMKDTVYYSEDGKQVSRLLNRSELYAGQAPEAFVLGRYLKANEQLLPTEILKINGSTEPAVLAGLDVVMIPGDEGNFKVTTKADLERFCAIVSGTDGNNACW